MASLPYNYFDGLLVFHYTHTRTSKFIPRLCLCTGITVCIRKGAAEPNFCAPQLFELHPPESGGVWRKFWPTVENKTRAEEEQVYLWPHMTAFDFPPKHLKTVHITYTLQNYFRSEQCDLFIQCREILPLLSALYVACLLPTFTINQKHCSMCHKNMT